METPGSGGLHLNRMLKSSSRLRLSGCFQQPDSPDPNIDHRQTLDRGPFRPYSADMIRISENTTLNEDELTESFIRASGPGGQNVNKVSTAVQLRFDAASSASLSPEVRERLIKIAGKRITAQGILIIEAKRFRTREQNRKDARDRLVELIRQAEIRPKTRRINGPPRSSRIRRLETKHRRSKTKAFRRKVVQD